MAHYGTPTLLPHEHWQNHGWIKCAIPSYANNPNNDKNRQKYKQIKNRALEDKSSWKVAEKLLWQTESTYRESDMRFSTSDCFTNQFLPGPRVSCWAISNFEEWDIRNCVFIAGVNDTGDKLFTNAMVTSDKLLPVLLSPVIQPGSEFSSIPWHRRLPGNNNKQQLR